MEFEKWFWTAPKMSIILYSWPLPAGTIYIIYIILFSRGLGVFFFRFVSSSFRLSDRSCTVKTARVQTEPTCYRWNYFTNNNSHSLRLSDGRDCATIAISTHCSVHTHLTIPTPRCYWRMVISKVLAGLPATVTDNIIHNTVPTTWKLYICVYVCIYIFFFVLRMIGGNRGRIANNDHTIQSGNSLCIIIIIIFPG